MHRNTRQKVITLSDRCVELALKDIKYLMEDSGKKLKELPFAVLVELVLTMFHDLLIKEKGYPKDNTDLARGVDIV